MVSFDSKGGLMGQSWLMVYPWLPSSNQTWRATGKSQTPMSVPNSDVRSWVSSRMGLVRVASPRPSDWHGMTLPLWTVVAATFRRKTFRRKPVLSFKQSGAPLERSSGGHHMSDPAHGEQLPPSHPDACQKVRTKSRR